MGHFKYACIILIFCMVLLSSCRQQNSLQEPYESEKNNTEIKETSCLNTEQQCDNEQYESEDYFVAGGAINFFYTDNGGKYPAAYEIKKNDKNILEATVTIIPNVSGTKTSRCQLWAITPTSLVDISINGEPFQQAPEVSLINNIDNEMKISICLNEDTEYIYVLCVFDYKYVPNTGMLNSIYGCVGYPFFSDNYDEKKICEMYRGNVEEVEISDKQAKDNKNRLEIGTKGIVENNYYIEEIDKYTCSYYSFKQSSKAYLKGYWPDVSSFILIFLSDEGIINDYLKVYESETNVLFEDKIGMNGLSCGEHYLQVIAVPLNRDNHFSPKSLRTPVFIEL